MLTALVVLTLVPLSEAAAQWQRVDTYFGISDYYATNLVAADAEYVYVTALVGQPVPNRFVILRSPDDGASWSETFSDYNGAARGTFLGDLDGRMAALVTGNGETGLLISNDHGATWAETAARIPISGTGVARMGETYVVVGSNPSYRSTDGGATWTPLGQNQPMGSVRSFGGTYYALDGISRLYRLDGDAWAQGDFGALFATHYWVDGGQLWVKAAAGSLYASGDGAAWSAQTTAVPTMWAYAFPTPDDGTPWFLHSLDLLLSDDDGATVASIADGYPRDDNGNLCISNYAVTPRVVIGNAWACSFTEPERNGVFRYAFETPRAQAHLDPTFGVSGKVIFPFNGFEQAVAVLPSTGTNAVGDGTTLVVGASGSLARLTAAGTLD